MGLGYNVMYWFRKDLRFYDNFFLCEVLVNCRIFYVVYIIDLVSVRVVNVFVNRWKFFLDCLIDFDKSFRDCGLRFYVIRG